MTDKEKIDSLKVEVMALQNTLEAFNRMSITLTIELKACKSLLATLGYNEALVQKAIEWSKDV